MLTPSLQALVVGHCSRKAWDGVGVRPLCRGLFQSAPNFELMALIGIADIAEPAVDAARRAGYISEVRLLLSPHADEVQVVGPSAFMEPRAWAAAVQELDEFLVSGDLALIATEVWLADDELSSLSLLLASATIRAEMQNLGFDIPSEDFLRQRLAERRSLFPGYLEAAIDAEVQQMMKEVS